MSFYHLIIIHFSILFNVKNQAYFVLRGAIRAKSGKPVKILGSLAVSFLTVNFVLFMTKNQYTSTKYQLNFNIQITRKFQIPMTLFRILNLGHCDLPALLNKS
jgi:hypothetical protein